MKKIILTIFLIIAFAFGLVMLANEDLRNPILNPPCSVPIEYSIGTIDPKFNLTQEKFLENAQSAEKIWEDSAGKNLFEYNPQASLKINLIFDERQQQTLETTAIQESLEQLDLSHKSTSEKYALLVNQYKEKTADFKAKTADYEKQLSAYEKDVRYWNDQGGAPEEEYKKLEKEGKRLESLRGMLEKERKEINALVETANQVFNKDKKIVKEYNANVETYKSKFGESREFEKGVFDGKEINIYEFRENNDLLLTLTHEMGHALKIDHVQNPESIMHYMIGEQDLQNPHLTDEDISALKEVCKMK